LIIHACSEANVQESNFSANFPLVSVFQCEVSGWLSLSSEWLRISQPDSPMTHLDARGSAEDDMATCVRTITIQVLKSHLFFLCAAHIIFCPLSLHINYFVMLFKFFSVLAKTVRIFLLGIFFEIIFA
jgi:hypothetical protein